MLRPEVVRLTGICNNAVTSLIIAVILGASFYGAAKVVPPSIRLGRTPRERILILIIILVIVIGAFYALAVLRSMYLQKMGWEESNPHIFVMLNLFFFLAASAYGYFYLPTRNDELEIGKHREFQREIEKIENEINELKERRDHLSTALSESLRLRRARMHYEDHVKDWIDGLRDAMVEFFISEHVTNREDSRTPKCFSNGANGQSNYFKNKTMQP